MAGISGAGSATTKQAEITLDTDLKGRANAFNPAELFLAAVAACMIKGIERATRMLKFELRGVEVTRSALRGRHARDGADLDRPAAHTVEPAATAGTGADAAHRPQV